MNHQLDMERVMERFQHYGQLYGDAPASAAADDRERPSPPIGGPNVPSPLQLSMGSGLS